MEFPARAWGLGTYSRAGWRQGSGFRFRVEVYSVLLNKVSLSLKDRAHLLAGTCSPKVYGLGFIKALGSWD